MEPNITASLPPGYEVVNPSLDTWFDDTLEEALLAGASDVLVRSNGSGHDITVLIRIDGKMQYFRHFNEPVGSNILHRFRSAAKIHTGTVYAPQEALYPVRTPDGPRNARVTSFQLASGGTTIVFRLPQYGPIRTLSQLNFTEHNRKLLEELLSHSSGAIIFAGPMGSGKTTAAHGAILHQHNGERSIWSVEDPVERVIEGVEQIEVNEKNNAGFKELLPAIVRSDYDMLFLGEIRDHDTAAAALRQAKAGRQVISTIHANDNITALLRLIELSKESPASVLDSVRGVVSQRLIGRLNPDAAVEPHRKYKGRLPVHEVLILDKDVIQTFIDGRPLAEVRKTAYDASRSTLHDNANELMFEGKTDAEEILRVLGPAY